MAMMTWKFTWNMDMWSTTGRNHAKMVYSLFNFGNMPHTTATNRQPQINILQLLNQYESRLNNNSPAAARAT